MSVCLGFIFLFPFISFTFFSVFLLVSFFYQITGFFAFLFSFQVYSLGRPFIARVAGFTNTLAYIYIYIIRIHSYMYLCTHTQSFFYVRTDIQSGLHSHKCAPIYIRLLINIHTHVIICIQ